MRLGGVEKERSNLYYRPAHMGLTHSMLKDFIKDEKALTYLKKFIGLLTIEEDVFRKTLVFNTGTPKCTIFAFQCNLSGNLQEDVFKTTFKCINGWGRGTFRDEYTSYNGEKVHFLDTYENGTTGKIWKRNADFKDDYFLANDESGGNNTIEHTFSQEINMVKGDWYYLITGGGAYAVIPKAYRNDLSAYDWAIGFMIRSPELYDKAVAAGENILQSATFDASCYNCDYDFCNANTSTIGCSQQACIQAGAAAEDADPATGWCIYVHSIMGDCVPNYDKCYS